MNITAVPTLYVSDPNINRIQVNIVPKLNQLIQVPINQGNLLQNVSLASGDNTIAHGLGTKLTGWFLTRMRSVFRQVYDKQDTGADPENYLYLNSSGAVTCDIFVF